MHNGHNFRVFVSDDVRTITRVNALIDERRSGSNALTRDSKTRLLDREVADLTEFAEDRYRA